MERKYYKYVYWFPFLKVIFFTFIIIVRNSPLSNSPSFSASVSKHLEKTIIFPIHAKVFFQLSLFRMGVFQTVHESGGQKIGVRGQKGNPSLKPDTYPTMMKLATVILYLKKIQKIYKSCDTLLEFCWHSHFFTGNQQILLYQVIQI